ncbi:hypothetical protein [Sphingosinicella sp. CPCC 101087]|uniref:hypothetical protein n=1 Tax=Sphingosinicella sp. CPCC 101087 TaxID=2497754 RepID=UPI00101DDCCB|nr:hypothetical protein [Sphingosinicella sp. CPCC 101087]
MRRDHDGMLLVRAELCDRLDRLQGAAERMSVRDLMGGIGTIRTLAAAYGLAPVVSLAEALSRAVQAQPRGCPAGLYFDRLRDAIGCERIDPQASEALLASVSVRFGD